MLNHVGGYFARRICLAAYCEHPRVIIFADDQIDLPKISDGVNPHALAPADWRYRQYKDGHPAAPIIILKRLQIMVLRFTKDREGPTESFASSPALYTNPGNGLRMMDSHCSWTNKICRASARPPLTLADTV